MNQFWHVFARGGSVELHSKFKCVSLFVCNDWTVESLSLHVINCTDCLQLNVLSIAPGFAHVFVCEWFDNSVCTVVRCWWAKSMSWRMCRVKGVYAQANWKMHKQVRRECRMAFYLGLIHARYTQTVYSQTHTHACNERRSWNTGSVFFFFNSRVINSMVYGTISVPWYPWVLFYACMPSHSQCLHWLKLVSSSSFSFRIFTYQFAYESVRPWQVICQHMPRATHRSVSKIMHMHDDLSRVFEFVFHALCNANAFTMASKQFAYIFKIDTVGLM